jgi:prepilin-type N-terminal cleavage/methylation domain-containing protein
MQRSTHRVSVRRAFSLVEMLTVIGILVIVMSIIIPAMNSARKTAKMTDTRSTLASLQNAVTSFNTENRRDPGYFSPKQMGSAANAANTGGWTAMDNIMLDLQGGVVAPNSTVGVNMGPGTAGQVRVDLAGFGATHQGQSGAIIKNYFVADAKKMVQQKEAGQRFGTGAGGTAGGGDKDNILPSLVDAFGQPILAWQQDNPNAPMFVDMASPPANSQSLGAQFYWNQNAGFLNSAVIHLGRSGENQAYVPGGSLLASDNSQQRIKDTMTALLGNPSAANTTVTPVVPTAPRGPIVFHSAGPDGVFVGKGDKGGGTGSTPYTPNQDAFNGTRFDDQIMAGGH